MQSQEHESEDFNQRLDRNDAQIKNLKIAMWALGLVILLFAVPSVGVALGLLIACLLIPIGAIAYVAAARWLTEQYSGDGDRRIP